MPSLLFEIGCEELPASACREAEAQLPELCRRHVGAEPSRLFIGPRRLAVLVEELPERTEGQRRRGPAERAAFDDAGKPTKAAEGFARAAGVAVEELERDEGHVWAHVPGEEIAASLPDRLAEVVRGLAFSKTMHWGTGLRFPRPVRWLCAKLDSDTVLVPLVQANGYSYGHRFTHGRVEIESAQAYAETLRSVDVEPDALERERAIVSGLDPLGEWSDPLGKLAEVVHLVEKPIVLDGSFDERYLELPERVVVTAMQSHQRYFPLGANRFAVVANGGDPDVVRAGHEQVLEARLEDARFSYDRDVAKGIDALAEELGSITFFAEAGSFADKAERLGRLVDALGGGEASHEAARLAKADQGSELVREFPDLEGHIGAHYAQLAGYPEAVAAAIDEQYLPDSAGGPLPQTEPGKVVAAADKLDNLNVSFGLGHRPSGSRDPFGLRRDAIGLVRLASEGRLAIPLELLDPEPREFVTERLEGLLDVPVEFVRAVRASAVRELGTMARLAQALARLDDDRLGRLDTAHARAHRLAGKEGGAADALDPNLLTEPAEREVAEVLQRVAPRVESAIAAGDLDEAMSAAEELGPPVDRFFDEVLVMAEDAAVRANRLRLLLDVRDTVGLLGDFSQIPR
jgi:glycyl-tRNA synthetase beta chain